MTVLGLWLCRNSAFLFYLTLTHSLDEGFELLWESNLDEIENATLESEGSVPGWIKGALIRNGAGRYEMGPHSLNHVFDGFAKLTKFEFDRGSVKFSTKFLRSDFYKDSLRENDIAAYLTVGNIHPKIGFLRKMLGLLRGIHNMDVNIESLKVGNSTKYYALNDIWRMYEFNPNNLDTINCVEPPTILDHPVKQKRQDFLLKNELLEAIKTQFENVKNIEGFSMDPRLSSAHPLKEYDRESWITYYAHVNLITGKAQVFVYRVRSLENPETVAVLDFDKTRYMHSFGMTKNYAIFTANTCYVEALKEIESFPFDCIRCDTEDFSTVFVVDLRNNQVWKMKTKSFFIMHHINAYEADDYTVVCDMTDHHNFSQLKNLTRDILLDKRRRDTDIRPLSQYLRLVINLKTNEIDFSYLETQPGYEFISTSEMPAINPAKRFNKHCFIYGLAFSSDNKHFANMTLTKKDVCGGNGDRFWQIENHYPGEPRFLGSPGATEEDDGVLLAVVLNGIKRKSYLAIIDAKRMKLISASYTPTTIPSGIHGKFFEEL